MMNNFSAKRRIALAAALIIIVSGVSAGSQSVLGRQAEKPDTIIDLSAAINPGTEIRVGSLIIETNAGASQTIDAPQSKPEPVSLISRPVYARDFSDLSELQRWLEGRESVVTLYFQYPGDEIDCDDYASALQRAALEDGYLLSFQIIDADKYNSHFKNSSIPAGSTHALNLAIAGNGAYLIEPQTGEVVFTAYVD